MEPLEPWLVPAAILAGSLAAGFVVQAVLRRRLKGWTAKEAGGLDDAVVNGVLAHLPLWIGLGGLAAAAQEAPLGARHVLVLHKAVVAFLLLSLTWSLSKIASALARRYSASLHGSARTTGVVDNLVRAVVVVLGGLLILANLGISIAPLLGALGVGSLAVALALQDTLTNLFAGLHIVASEIVSVGDLVRLDSGQEGVITDVGWRVTRIRELAGHDVILPNSKLANAVVTNFHRPAPDVSVPVPFGVAYGSDLEAVERVVQEVGREVQEAAQGATRGALPVVRFQSFGDSAIQLAVVLRADTYPDRFRLVHEFIRRAAPRFAKEGIELPPPPRHVRPGK